VTTKRFLTIVSWLAFMGMLLSFASSGFSAQEDRIRGAIESNGTVALKGNVHPEARPENDRGALDLSTRINGVKLVLGQTDRQAADLEQLLEEQRNPLSADYRNWLSPEEYGERFGVSRNDFARLTSWLQSRGLAVELVARARNWITFSATAGQIAATFRTELHHYEAGGEPHFANASEPSIPASLTGVVIAVRGLDDFRPRPQPATIKVNPDFDASNGSHYLAPDDLTTIYDVQALYKAGFDGTGQKLAIVGQTDINVADIRAFRSAFNLPAKDPQIVLAGADPGVRPGDQIEATLDLEWSGAVARNATIVYVYSQNVFESLQYAIDQNLAPAVSVSYGGCETGSPTSYRTLAQQANAQGITWMNASGDSGAAGCDDGEKVATHPPAVTFPADIPEVTAVGGTELNDTGGTFWSNRNGAGLGSALSYIPERAWNDTSLGYGLASGGGGASSIYSKPWWQAGSGVPNDQARDVPDVSLTASGAHDGYVIYANGALMAVGGTSASSPSFAGIVAILNQYLVAKEGLAKPGLGNINPSLYSLAGNTADVFHDVTAGDNIVPCAAAVQGCGAGSYGYKAGPGYDLTTGLGSVDAYNLVTKWTSLPPAVGTKLVLSASPAGIPQSATTQLTATVSAVTGANAPAGTVAFASGTAPLGSAVLTGSGAIAVATLSVKGSSLAVGLNPITASYAAASGFSSSTATATVTVTAPAIGTSITANANPAAIAQSGSTVLTATVKQASGSNAPAGLVAFALGKTVLGTAALTASATGSTAALLVNGASLAAGANSIIVTYGGSSGFNSSTAMPFIITVAPLPVATTTTLTANPATISQIASTVLTAIVEPASGSALPTGTVAFTSGSASLGTANLSISGAAMAATLIVKGTSLAVGNNSITATWSGTAGFASSAGVLTVTVNPAPVATTITVVATPTNIAPNTTTLLTATVKAVMGNAGATGSVSFASGSAQLGTARVTVSGGIGTAVLTVKGSSLAVGSNNITAIYTATGNFSGATSSVVVNVITPAIGTTMVVAASPASIVQTAATQLIAIVRAAAGSSSPTGSITFATGKTALGAATLAGSEGIATATLTVKGSSLIAGNNVVTAAYAGGSFSASAASVAVNVVAATAAALK
jgi:hypothetical protein